ncbi:MAG: 50S ribosomal protein L35 [Chloroflexi bacterium]|nr:MAG: 50S ribosomal protein L35 [Chloroflexota bacterium]
MPKLKTRKGISKRVRVTRNGKLVRRNSWTSHRLHQKSKTHKRKDHTEQPVSKADRKTVRRALGV